MRSTIVPNYCNIMPGNVAMLNETSLPVPSGRGVGVIVPVPVAVAVAVLWPVQPTPQPHDRVREGRATGT